MDCSVPTTEDRLETKDPICRDQAAALQKNCEDFGVTLFGLGDAHQGTVHVIGPELGATLPGLTIVCGDSRTSTHGAFGALAFGIGTSEVEHVLVTQTLVTRKPRTCRVEFAGRLAPHVLSKDMVLKLIGTIGTAGGSGHVFEYCGEAVRTLSMEARMSICNMSIEAGARAGMIAPDETTLEYVARQERPYAPKGEEMERARVYWKTLSSDGDAAFDRSLTIDAGRIAPHVTWGTNPGMVMDIDQPVPAPEAAAGYSRTDVENAPAYMGLEPGTRLTDQVKSPEAFRKTWETPQSSRLRMAISSRRPVSADNALAIHVYRRSGFEIAQKVEWGENRPGHPKGGCVLMK